MPDRSQPETIDPLWLFKALALAVVAGLVCAWLAVCLLVYQGAWQIVLHPSSKMTVTPTVPFERIPFDAGPTGSPRLTAWWIPAGSTTAPTILFLHAGSGNLSNSATRLDELHNLNLNLFAIDYRGFGQSESEHPSQIRMLQDTQAALDYLEQTRHIPASQIIPQGVGLGACLATQLAIAHPELPAIILEDPDPNLATQALADRHTTFVPASLLLRDRFDIIPLAPRLHQPKLILLTHVASPPFLQSFPDPKITVYLPPDPTVSTQSSYAQSIARFLSQYLSK